MNKTSEPLQQEELNLLDAYLSIIEQHENIALKLSNLSVRNYETIENGLRL